MVNSLGVAIVQQLVYSITERDHDVENDPNAAAARKSQGCPGLRDSEASWWKLCAVAAAAVIENLWQHSACTLVTYRF